VYRVMTTNESVTGAGHIPIGYAALIVAYIGVAIALVWILRRLMNRPLDDGGEHPPGNAPIETQPA
jgi:cytochrome bd ubiquinol oxidase subunit I